MEHLCYSLLCVSRPVLEKANEELAPGTPAGVVANTVRAIPARWPQRGQLIVQLNADDEAEEAPESLFPWQLVRFGAFDSLSLPPRDF